MKISKQRLRQIVIEELKNSEAETIQQSVGIFVERFENLLSEAKDRKIIHPNKLQKLQEVINTLLENNK